MQGNWQGGRDLAMTKDASGLWSVTTAALQPELWAYTFSVDGVRTLDPRNYNVARDGVGFMNTVLVLGDASAVFQPQPGAAWNRDDDVGSVDADEDAAPHVRLHAARVRGEHHQVPRAVPAARQRRRRRCLAHHGHRQRDHGQCDRAGQGQAHDRGDAERLLERDRFAGSGRSAHGSASGRGRGRRRAGVRRTRTKRTSSAT